ncbi:MAG: YncE family protein [Bacteroidales bacterium]|nr:YncE family protein [Bacteroidales bacterium]
MNKIAAYILLIILLALSSCMKDDELWDRDTESISGSPGGLFIVNEGNFMYNNASLSYYDTESRKVYNDIFFNTNGLPLGDVASSMTIKDGLAWIVLNNSGKINIMNTSSFEYTGKVTGLTSPRHIHFISDSKAYVSDLYAQAITIVDPRSKEISGYIDVSNNASPYGQHPTEQMVSYGRYVFVSCWSYDNKILVIDSNTDKLIDSIEVLIQPRSMVIDRFSKIWVLSDGGYEGSPYGYEAPGLIKIDAELRTVEQVWRFETGDNPASLALNGGSDTLFYINRHVYRMPVHETQAAARTVY